MSKLAKVLEVKEGKLVATPKATPKKEAKKLVKKEAKKYAEIYGIRLGAKPNANLRIAVKVFKANQNKTLSWSQLLELYKKELLKNDYKIDKNTVGRLARILSRTNLSGIARESVQGLKFNLSANYNGIKVKTKFPFKQNDKFNVDRSQVYENTYQFIFADKGEKRILKAELTEATKKKLAKFKETLK